MFVNLFLGISFNLLFVWATACSAKGYKRIIEDAETAESMNKLYADIFNIR